ncbi:MAG TPA: hypothetical protein ENK01_04520, partial [Hellea balneolensis]|nr:hypothetical protein [Hellea balneolensis]
MAQTVRNALHRPATEGPQPQVKPSANQEHDWRQYLEERKTAKKMRLLAVAFLVFYLLLVGSKSFEDFKAEQRATRAQHITYAQGLASQISTEIENAIIWTNNGLSEGQTPLQSARLIAKSPGIEMAAILSDKNKFIAAWPKNTSLLSEIRARKPENIKAITLNSLIHDSGKVTPLLLMPGNQFVTVVALEPTALLKPAPGQQGFQALITSSGRIISGNPEVVRQGPRRFFGLDEKSFDRLAHESSRQISTIKLAEEKFYLSSVKVPN